jgi:hypothetical protein
MFYSALIAELLIIQSFGVKLQLLFILQLRLIVFRIISNRNIGLMFEYVKPKWLE